MRVGSCWVSRGGGTLGELGGESAHTLTASEMPEHSHPLLVDEEGNDGNAGRVSVTISNGTQSEWFVRPAGGSQPHNNMPPYKTVSIWERIK